MSRISSILAGGVGIAMAMVAAGEHVGRRLAERRYHDALQRQRGLELQVGEILATHQQLQDELTHERQRAGEVGQTLASARLRLDETMEQLAEASRAVQELRLQVVQREGQMEQLQGELASALQARQGSAGGSASSPIRLDRILIGSAEAEALQGRVLSVSREWDFVVLDFGWDAVTVGDTVSIFRDDQLLAKARVERVQEKACAATILPEWKRVEIRANDRARVL